MSADAVLNEAATVGRETRIVREGYGSGAWHGPDLKAALADVPPVLAFWRPASGRHNIAEIALHHAYTVRSVHGQISGAPLQPFVLAGEDWFAVSDAGTLEWPRIQQIVEAEQRQLEQTIAEIEAGRASSPLGSDERFALVLGITCHGVYHAGQVQLIKRLSAQ